MKKPEMSRNCSSPTSPGRGVGWQKSALSIFMYRKFDVIMTMFSHNIYKGEVI